MNGGGGRLEREGKTRVLFCELKTAELEATYS